jgi:hypothetical protein
MSNFTDAKRAYESAQEDFHKAIKDEVRESLEEIFADDSVENVIWGVALTPYNDENPGIGIFGPLINALEKDEDGDYREIEYDHDGVGYNLFYDWRGTTPSNRLQRLFSELGNNGAQTMADAFGVRYDEHGGPTEIYVAGRTDDGYFDFHSYSVDSY